MMWFLGALLIAVIAASVLLVQGRLGGMPDLPDDRPVPRLPPGEFGAGDVTGLRFARVPRGYAPAQVDELLRRVRDTLTDGRDALGFASAADIRGSGFDVVSHGYQMHQVDVVLERLARQLDHSQAAHVAHDTEPGDPVAADPQGEQVSVLVIPDEVADRVGSPRSGASVMADETVGRDADTSGMRNNGSGAVPTTAPERPARREDVARWQQ